MYICPQCRAEYPPGSPERCPTDGAPLMALRAPGAAGSDPWLGRVLGGRYFLERQIGLGGMGAVYLGRDQDDAAPGRRVAVKVIHHEALKEPVHVRRFWQEARAARAIDHSTVVRVLDFGETQDKLPYLVMEYVAGETLDALMRRKGRLPLARAVTLARALLDGVEAAHRCQVMHRDLKPQNLIVVKDDEGERLKILDFGLAKACDANPDGVSLTETGVVFGTPEYMSPEQARGEKVDFRTDIYAAGCVIYELLAGRRPFEATSALAMLLHHMRTPVPPFDQLPEPVDVPAPLSAVIYKAMHKNREQRFQTATEMRLALESATAGHTVPDLPEEVRKRHRAMARGGGRWLIAGGVAGAALLGLAGWQISRTTEPVAPPPPEPPSVAAVATSAPPPSDVAVRFDSTPSGAMAEIQAVEPPGAVLARARTPAELRLPPGKRLRARFTATGYEELTIQVEALDGARVLAELRPLAVAPESVAASLAPTPSSAPSAEPRKRRAVSPPPAAATAAPAAIGPDDLR